MKHRFRFFARTIGSNEWSIRGEEFAHLKKVLKLKPGSEVEVFDGEGRWGIGQLVGVEKDNATVLVTQTKKEDLIKPKLVLALGALQQKTMTELFPCLVELGVDAIHILDLEGSPKHRTNEKTLERWQRILLSSLKQCKRATLPTLEIWSDLERFVEFATQNLPHRWLLDPDGAQSLDKIDIEAKESICLVLGNEGGFSGDEIELLERSGFPKLSLGRFTLRSFTATVAALAVLSAKRGSGT